MICRKCRIKMVEMKRSFHKRRKWVCPKCGRARMQTQRPRLPKTRSDEKG